MKDTIMTEKIARRGVRVPVDYAADFLEQISVSEVATHNVVALRADQTVGEARSWMAQHAPGSAHHGFPVVDKELGVLGLVSRRQVLDPREPDGKRLGDLVHGPFVAVFEDNSLRQAVDLMAREKLGRLPVVDRNEPRNLVAIVSGSDIRAGIRQWLEQSNQPKQTLGWRRSRP